jgi:hypothetical protein
MQQASFGCYITRKTTINEVEWSVDYPNRSAVVLRRIFKNKRLRYIERSADVKKTTATATATAAGCGYIK